MVGPGAWDAFEGRIAGALNVIFELGNISSVQWNPAIAFNNAYEEKYGKKIEAGHGPAPAYESVYILANAINAAGSLDPDDIVSALEKTDRSGVMGRIRFNRAHQVFFGDDPGADALACIFQWQKDGRRTIVYPLSIADGEIELPVSR
jgi:branched-chain amino acid transport system substrate-binding protein